MSHANKLAYISLSTFYYYITGVSDRTTIMGDKGGEGTYEWISRFQYWNSIENIVEHLENARDEIRSQGDDLHCKEEIVRSTGLTFTRQTGGIVQNAREIVIGSEETIPEHVCWGWWGQENVSIRWPIVDAVNSNQYKHRALSLTRCAMRTCTQHSRSYYEPSTKYIDALHH